jgi:hypothetical protein
VPIGSAMRPSRRTTTRTNWQSKIEEPSLFTANPTT